MTRHNLAGHISWLLSSGVAPPRSAHNTASLNSAAIAQAPCIYISVEDEEQEDFGALTTVALSRGSARPANIPEEFVRPAIPSIDTQKSHTHQTVENLETKSGSMGKLSSASRSKRPALVSQQNQLATPASTTAGTPTLLQNYTNLLIGNGW